jgi:type IV pilus assembly protein PilN
MMIRINLLPLRQVKRREEGRQILVVYAGALVVALALNYLWWNTLDGQKQQHAQRIARTQQRIAELEKVIGDVNNLNKRKAEIEKRLKVLDEVRKSRSGPVRMMDALATATPKRVWLNEMTEAANSVKLRGTALSHDDVAEFMRSLSGVVWTPKGLGRLVELKRETKTSRVELATQGVIAEFPNNEVAAFFTGIDLKKAERKDVKSDKTVVKNVDFEISMAANYAI